MQIQCQFGEVVTSNENIPTRVLKEISFLVSLLTENGFKVFAIDLTSADVNRLGYKVVRVFILIQSFVAIR